MAPQKKKQTREERLEKKRIAERRRKEKIKKDPLLYAALKEKDKQRYIRLKEEKKIIPMAEMTPRSRRNRQKRNRINFKKFYDRKKSHLARNITQDILSIPPQVSQCDIPEQKIFNTDLTLTTNSTRNLRPRATSSPCPKSRSFVTSPNVSTINSFESSICPSSPGSDISENSYVSLRTKFKRYQNQKSKEILALRKKIIQLSQAKERYKKKLQRSIDSQKNKSLPNAPPVSAEIKTAPKLSVSKAVDNKLRNLVKKFYQDDANSRQCPGKKDCITKNGLKMQKRYLTDSIKNLHKKYLQSANPPISYVTFSRLRPFWIIKPDINSRNTCICKIHYNMELIVSSLKRYKIINENTTTEISQTLCCDQVSVKCLLRLCWKCKNKTLEYLDFNNADKVIYWAWEKEVKTFLKDNIENKTNIIKKVRYSVKPTELIDTFEKQINPFLKHCGNIKNQYETLNVLKQRLLKNECIIHIDFSENYNSKYHAEIQSIHFGANRSQLTLHTSMIYYRSEDGTPKSQALCTVSASLRHDAAAVWAHIIPILREIETIAPKINKLTIVSDSPTGQYRNKKIFYIMSQLISYYTDLTHIVWHYCECGHGKGAPDGIGGVLKRTADDRVAYGDDITDIQSLVECLKRYVKGVNVQIVEEYEITEKEWLIPPDLKPFSGTFKVHQAVWTKRSKTRLALRSLSCIEPECLNDAVECRHGMHLGFYELSEDQNQILSKEPTESVFLTPQENSRLAKKPQILEVKRFKAGDNFFLRPKINDTKQTPSTSGTARLSLDSIDTNLFEDDWIKNKASISFFDNLKTDDISQYENSVNTSKNKTVKRRPIIDFDLDSDSDESIF